MMYEVKRNPAYDFKGVSHSDLYPPLHRYPAAMLPHIGIKLLQELNISKGTMLDPYCGSGSSFLAGIHEGITQGQGFDLNPLAVAITKGRLTQLNISQLHDHYHQLHEETYNFIAHNGTLNDDDKPSITNQDFWFSANSYHRLSVLYAHIKKITDDNIRQFFWIAFSGVARKCSYTRDHEFKLYKMKDEDAILFNPDVLSLFFNQLKSLIAIYERHYHDQLSHVAMCVACAPFTSKQNTLFDVVLTSPPYGDSRTTVAYGQFSTFANEWQNISHARKIDKLLMGGQTNSSLYDKGIIADAIKKIAVQSAKRAIEVSSFYDDLKHSIKEVAASIRKGGTAIYIVGNRCVKDVLLPTDQFIAEQFEQAGLKHLVTYERLISHKSMPLKNSPSNKKNHKRATMTQEYIVICAR